MLLMNRQIFDYQWQPYLQQDSHFRAAESFFVQVGYTLKHLDVALDRCLTMVGVQADLVIRFAIQPASDDLGFMRLATTNSLQVAAGRFILELRN